MSKSVDIKNTIEGKDQLLKVNSCNKIIIF